MRLFLPYRKATLLIPSGPDHDPERHHLFVILTDPQPDSNTVLLVSLSTLRRALPHDATCVIAAGEHPFVRRNSYVFYARARIELVETRRSGRLQDSLPSPIPPGFTEEAIAIMNQVETGETLPEGRVLKIPHAEP